MCLELVANVALHWNAVNGEDDVFLVFEKRGNLCFPGILAGFVGAEVGFAITKRFEGRTVGVSTHVPDVGARASALNNTSDGDQEGSGSTTDAISFSKDATVQSVHQSLRVGIDE